MSTRIKKPTPSTLKNSRWEAMKEDIRRIYLTEHKTLSETRNEIKDIYNFSASERTWKYHLDEWHFNKKLTQEEKAFVLSKAQKRHLEDKEIIFYHNGVLLDTNKIERLKRQRISKECNGEPLAACTPDAITYHTPENLSEEDTNAQPDLEIDVFEEHRKARDYIQTTVFDEASVPNSPGSTDAHQPSSTAELFSHLPSLEQDETIAQSFNGASNFQSSDFPSESAHVSVMGDGVDLEPVLEPQDCGTEYLVDIDTRGWPPPSDGLSGLSTIIGTGSPIVFGPEASFLFTLSPSLNYVSLSTPQMPASDCSLFDKDFDSEYCHELFSWTLDTAYAEPSLQRNSESRRELSVASSDSFGKEPFPYAKLMNTLVRHLPWFQFHDLVDRYGLNRRNIAFASALNSVEALSTRPPRHSDAFGCEEMCEALEMRYKIVSGFVSNARLNDTFQISADKLTNQLSQLIPERNCGEIKMKVQHTFNRMNKFPAFQIFEWALYLSSNNLLSEDETDNLLVWIIEERLLGPLISLLEQKLPTIVAFAARILESAVRIGTPAVLSQLLESSIDSSVCRGPRGAMLLHERLARYWCQRLYKKDTESETVFDLVRILLLNGAHPGLSMSYCDGTSALLYAARNRNFRMVELFSKFGANVTNTALACAVERDDITSINMLLDLGADVDKSHVGKISILEWAAMRSSSIYEMLLKRSSLAEEVVHIAGVLHAAKQSTLSSYIKQSDGFLSYKIRKDMEFALMQAVRYRDGYKITETLLQFGVNPNTPTQSREHPLEIASMARSMGKVKLLVSAGASVNTPGVLCAASRNFKLLKFLIDSGADIDTFGSAALYEAVRFNRLKCVSLLLRSGVNVNSRYLGRTPLEKAAERGSIEIAQMLVQHGAIVNTNSGINYESTALESAVGFGCYDLVEYLLDMGADVNPAPGKFERMTALVAAAHRCGGEEKTRIIKLLLSRGAVFNRRPEDIGGTTITTALHGLISTGEDELCCLAVSEGVDVNYMTSGEEGRTPLQLAAEKGHLEIVKLLLKHGAQVNAPPAPRFGRTALQAAACCESPALDIIQILLEEGAEVNAEPATEGGLTAIQGAAIQGHVNVALALLKAHARVNGPPAMMYGRTAIEGAAEHGRLDMVKLLLEAGAVGDPDKGFEKAVKAADKHGHFAVADILREHMQRQAA